VTPESCSLGSNDKYVVEELPLQDFQHKYFSLIVTDRVLRVLLVRSFEVYVVDLFIWAID
jgi:hypothetical protein